MVRKMELKKELKHFKEILPSLLEDHKNEFALIIGDKLIGIFPNFDEAYEAGVVEIKPGKFLAQKIIDMDEDKAVFHSRVY